MTAPVVVTPGSASTMQFIMPKEFKKIRWAGGRACHASCFPPVQAVSTVETLQLRMFFLSSAGGDFFSSSVPFQLVPCVGRIPKPHPPLPGKNRRSGFQHQRPTAVVSTGHTASLTSALDMNRLGAQPCVRSRALSPSSPGVYVCSSRLCLHETRWRETRLPPFPAL